MRICRHFCYGQFKRDIEKCDYIFQIISNLPSKYLPKRNYFIVLPTVCLGNSCSRLEKAKLKKMLFKFIHSSNKDEIK